MGDKGAHRPKDVTISVKALAEIQRLVYEVKLFKGEENWLPAIVWMTNEGETTSQGAPSIAFYERHQIPEGLSENIDGLELVFALTQESTPFFEGRVIDCDGSRFVLR